jgi:hypothetical protein
MFAWQTGDGRSYTKMLGQGLRGVVSCPQNGNLGAESRNYTSLSRITIPSYNVLSQAERGWRPKTSPRSGSINGDGRTRR